LSRHPATRRQRTVRHGQRGPPLQLGLGGQQIGQPFRLGQIDTAVGEGAAGEFAGQCLA
jgi:hypothetical protein